VRIALIGMSGSGKSYWSHRLAQSGFTCFGCDDGIGRELARRTDVTDLTIEAVGRWMGFPFEDGFRDREAQYLALERRVLDRFLSDLEQQPDDPALPSVIDTTGSVVYLGDDLLRRLRRATVVVHLASPPARRQDLLAAYQACPRPVVWQEHFQPAPGEDPAAALARCYMALVDDRDRRYRRHAHLTIELPPPSAAPADPERLLAPVRAYLEENDRAAAP
jgi:shikimate kinase